MDEKTPTSHKSIIDCLQPPKPISLRCAHHHQELFVLRPQQIACRARLRALSKPAERFTGVSASAHNCFGPRDLSFVRSDRTGCAAQSPLMCPDAPPGRR